tara:strand:+ start:516 stop:812 length:297 start_codon:yes stop_codon:yes gene_type:complete
MRLRKNKNNPLKIFIKYTLSIIFVSLFLITFLTFKNQCAKLMNDIHETRIAIIKNTSIVKKLQSDKDYFSSQQYISSKVKDEMIAIAPEPEIINMRNE